MDATIYLISDAMADPSSKWAEENADPRIHWALKIFDQEGQHFEGEMKRQIMPVSLAVLPMAAITIHNWRSRMPLKSRKCHHFSLLF